MLNKRQSEILGIMFGDGSMSKVGGSIQIAVTGHKIEDNNYLISHVCHLFAQEFAINLKVRYRPDEQTMDIYTYSKSVALVLNSWGMPFGLKNTSKLRPTVPVFEAEFMKGLFDTDGCIYRKYKKYKQIQLKTSSKTLINYASKALKGLRFNPSAIIQDQTRYKIYLCRQAEIKRFFEEIAPSNQKHLDRFRAID